MPGEQTQATGATRHVDGETLEMNGRGSDIRRNRDWKVCLATKYKP